MQKLSLFILLISISFQAIASKVNASGFGWNASDATSALQSAIMSGADTIIINKQSGNWITRPNTFFDLSNKTVIFESGIVLQAKAGAFPGSCVDGFDISRDPRYGEQLYSENIFLMDLWCDNHYRQGIYGISTQHLLVNNCLLSNSSELNFLGSYGEIKTSPGMGNVKLNNLTVSNPNGWVTLNVTDGGGSPDTSCIFDYKKYTTLPQTSVTMTAQNRIIECSSQNSILESTRVSDNKNFPVSISYSIEGSAMHGEDFSRMNGFMIIPSNQASRKDTIYVLSDNSAEGAKCIIATLDPSPLFTSTLLPRFIFVYDCITGINDTPGNKKFTIFPNPVHNIAEIDIEGDYHGFIYIFDEKGRLVLMQETNDSQNFIDATRFANGIYFIKIQIDNKIQVEKIIKL